jgi:CubicO group peptidase (beta-lactamase class C family)
MLPRAVLRRYLPLALLAAAILLGSCRTAHPGARPGRAAVSRVFTAPKLAELDAAIFAAIASNKTPGGVLWLERHGAAYHRAYGDRAVEPEREPMTEDTIFDAASLTKVIATAPSVMLLAERGKLDVDAPVSRYLPDFAANGKAAITLRQLLTHTSGLPPGLSRADNWLGYDEAIRRACAEKLADAPGTRFRYSDINFIVLGEVVRRVSGLYIDQFSEQELFQPLGMVDTAFRPFDPAVNCACAQEENGRIAPTERQGDGVLRGTVHDPTSRRMGGIAGHAGLFTTAKDLARYSRMMLNRGELDGRRLLRPETVERMTGVQSPPGLPRRGFGWDIDSPYAGPRGAHFPIGSYGHTGWTGGSLWIDPFSGTFVIFLSNRNHPTEDGNVIALRRQIGTLAAEAVTGVDFAHVAGALPPEPTAKH